jgi:acyl-CoA synthetase (AMP-forming)/AMP-acid ligase II
VVPLTTQRRHSAEAMALLARSNPGTLPSLAAGSLADHKQQLAQAIDAHTTAFNANLRGERSAMLTNSLPGSVRVLLGALIVSAILFMITQ